MTIMIMMIMIATYEQVEPPDDKKEAEALDLQPARNRNTGQTGKLPEKNIIATGFTTKT